MISILLALLAPAHAAPSTTLGGYFRLMARPDLVGGEGRLGMSSTYGRLLNEGPWGLLEVRQALVGRRGEGGPWGALTLRVEGGATPGGDPTNGSLLGFRISQLHLDAGELGDPALTWRLGTLETTFGDLWLFDARPTQMLVDVLGVSATWARGGTEVLLGAGDAGWSIHGADYHMVASAGASVKQAVGDHVTVGIGGQAWTEPVDGAVRAASSAWKVATLVGLGELGPLRASRLQLVVIRHLPGPVDADGPSERHEVILGEELELEVVPDRFELALAGLLVHRFDLADRRSPTSGTALSAVARGQLALTGTLSLLAETSLAREGAPGAPTTDTWQGKGGVVLSPAGPGLMDRPAIRLLYGAQRSTAGSAWPGVDRGSRAFWHHLVSLEGEAWF